MPTPTSAAKPPAAVGPSTIIGLRQKYLTAWGVEWPHCNGYLSALWREAKQATGIGPSTRSIPEACWEFALDTMRESHEMAAV